MKKRILSIVLTLALTIGTCGIAAAADRGGATRNSLKSYGAIEYHKGNDKVIINSEDLYMLADQIDQVKLEVADQLEAMNTYFTAGDGISLDTDRYISVTHTRPSRTDFVDPISVNFDTLLEGIAASQSVSSDVTDYGYSPGTKLYKGADGELTTNGSEEGAEQISVSAATADNLSAGTVAWVNGRLILGTGGDNKAYFDSGYDNGKDTPPDDSGSNALDRVDCINIGNEGKIYTVPNDMTDVILVFFGSAKKNLVFKSSEVITYKEVFYKISGKDYGVACTMYFVPTLRKGTGIEVNKDNCYLIRVKEANGKNGNLTRETISGASYFANKDLKDVLLLQCGSRADPKIQEAPGNPIVAFKKLVEYGRPREENNQNYYYYSIYYIPDLKESSAITKHTGGELFY